jgi:hypothetical protein
MKATRRPRFAPAVQPAPCPATFVDPWRAICERCPLPDCVRQEGEYGTMIQKNWTKNAHARLSVCAIYKAQRAGLTPEQALANGAGLLPAWGVG